MSGSTEFRTALLARVLTAAGQNAIGTGDEEWAITGWSTSRRSKLRDLATRVGIRKTRFDPALAAERLGPILDRADGFARTWEAIDDAPSRQLMLDVLARRVLGAFHVELSPSPQQFQRIWEDMKKRRVGSETIRGPADSELPQVEYAGLRLWADPFQLTAFELGQYEAAQPGETVIDGGAGFGETALVFAQQVGPEGRVVAIELDPENHDVIERNLALNPGLAERVTLLLGAIWDRSGAEIHYAPSGGMSTVIGSGATAKTIAIDDLELGRIHRIKLDVEAAEPQALKGAARTLARDRPHLAIAAYHRADDLAVLPPLILDAEPSYRFRLGHFTPGGPETILVGYSGLRA